MRLKYFLNKIFLYNLFIIASSETVNYGVGLSITQLNDIKNQFDQVNIRPKLEKNIYQNKYHNFSEKFSLEDRLLLVRLYNRYTEEKCMTFKTFARKFKKKANEWINKEGVERVFKIKYSKNNLKVCHTYSSKFYIVF